ncbi:ribonuclease H-like domain-containing protein [Tanacetum coccineum]
MSPEIMVLQCPLKDLTILMHKADPKNPQQDLKNKGVINSGCSRHMIGNRSYLTDYEEIAGGFVTFGGNSNGGKITRKDFKLTDENHVLLKVPRKDNMYSVDLKNVVPQGGLTCLFAKATPDEYNIWHKRLGHVNFKTMNKLKGKQHRASCIANLIDLKVKVIRCDNETKFKNRVMNQFYEMKGIKREFSVPRTPQENEAKAVNTACYVQNRVLVIKPHNKTPYELFLGRKLALSFMRPFRCPVTILNTIEHLGTKACDDVGKARMETVPGQDYILLPMWPADPLFSQNSKESPDARFKPSEEEEKKDAEDLGNKSGNLTKGKDSEVPSTEEPRTNQEKNDYINSTNNINTSSDGNNTNNVNAVSSTINTIGIKVNAIDPKTSIELPNDLNMPELEDIVYSDDDEDVGAEVDMNTLDAFMLVNSIPTTRIHKDHPVDQIIRDLNSAPQTTRMTKNLKEHEEGIDYNEVFSPVARIKAIRLFLAYASFKDFVVYHMEVKSAFLYGKIEEEVYVCQPPGFEDPDFPNRVYKVEKALYGLHQALRAWYETLSTYLLESRFQKGQIDKTLFIKRDQANTPIENHKTLLKDVDGEDVDEHMYRSVIGSLMYLTSSRPDNVCCQPKLGLWYPKDSPFDLVAYTDSDYAGASLDRKSTTREAEYVAASSCCGQVPWIQNQLLDYGFSNEKKLIQMIKIRIDKNVADLLTKAFDKGIRVNAGDSKLMLLGINLLLLEKVNDARVLDLETTKTAQEKEIASLKKKVKKLERKRKSTTLGMERLFKIGRSTQVVSSEDEVTLVDETPGSYDDAQMFDTNVFNGEEVFVAEQSEKVVREVVSITEVKEEQARLAREKAEEANISWDNVQAMIEADRLLAKRLQEREQEELPDKEKARLFVVPDEEEVAIDAIPLATKPPSIMLRDFDREDLETLWKLVKAKHGSTRPEEGYERVL